MIYRVIGVMSGTSLDGVDLAQVYFDLGEKISFSIENAITVRYPKDLSDKIRCALSLSVEDFVALDKRLGSFIAENIIQNFDTSEIDLIASHGHTVLHKPEDGLNYQIGDGAVISAHTGVPVVVDFRSTDIAYGGQGAPLVPIGEKFLFSGFDCFLNLGGFSNVSKHNENIVAYDISPVNYALNFFALQLGMTYDKDGKLGKSGKIEKILLDELNSLEYYRRQAPKSLSDHWFYDVFLPIVKRYNLPVKNILRTVYENIAYTIGKELDCLRCKKVMITGGGAKNRFLIELLKKRTKAQLHIPDSKIIDYKEALIFAFLGILRLEGNKNVLASVTGAKQDNIGGAVYLP